MSIQHRRGLSGILGVCASPVQITLSIAGQVF
jgi:hypothetical protein